jgi:hypothetical protein
LEEKDNMLEKHLENQYWKEPSKLGFKLNQNQVSYPTDYGR